MPPSRRPLMERRTMFARSGTTESDPLRKWTALTASAIDLRIVTVTPLDAGRLPTCNCVADRDRLKLHALEKRTGS
jgi:hypothetical protein